MSDGLYTLKDPWLYIFRENLHSTSDTLEYATRAILYNPYDGYDNSHESLSDDVLERFSSISTCNGITIRDVSSIYALGSSVFVKITNIRFNLYKIYLLLNQGIDGIKKSLNERDVDKVHYERYLSVFIVLLKRFNQYIAIVTALCDSPVSGSPCNKESSLDDTVVDRVKPKHKFAEITSKFRIDQSQLAEILEFGDSENNVDDVKNVIDDRLMIRWSFYKSAQCSDIFALLCYTLIIGDYNAFKIILTNSNDCMVKHLNEHWKIALSYIPIACNYNNYKYVIDVIFSISQNPELEELINSIDWIIWRSFMIIHSTKSPYYLLKFVKTMIRLFDHLNVADEVLDSKLRLLRFLKCIIKQYVIYRSYKTFSMMNIHSLESKEYISFFEYLDLDASNKLQLFCDFNNSPVNVYTGCECDDSFKDEYKIYKHCLSCKTRYIIEKLMLFFKLINPPNRSYNVKNQFTSISDDFCKYFSSLIKSISSPLTSYIGDLYRNFQGYLDVRGFEILYSLMNVLLSIESKNSVYSILVHILFHNNTKYNIVEHFFIIKTLFTTLELDDSSDFEIDISDTHLSILFEKDNKLDVISKNNSKLISLYIKCQIDFMNSLLNLLSSLNCEDLDNLVITTPELINAICDYDLLLKLFQKLTVFILSTSLAPEDFSVCINQLIEISSSISKCDINPALFLTICLNSNDQSYFETHCNCWMGLSMKDTNSMLQFIRDSLACVYTAVYKLDMQSYSSNHFIQLVISSSSCTFDIYKNKYSFDTSIGEEHLSINDIIQIYLKVLGIDSDGCLSNSIGAFRFLMDNGEKVDDSTLAPFKVLGVIERIYKVFDTLGSDEIFHYGSFPALCYKLYSNKYDLALSSISSLSNLISNLESNYSDSHDKIVLRVFSLILSKFTQNCTDVMHTLEVIKKISFILCPQDIRQVVTAFVELVIDVASGNISSEALSSYLYKSPVVGPLASNLASVFFWELQNVSYISLICQHCCKTELPLITKFIQDSVYMNETTSDGQELDGKVMGEHVDDTEVTVNDLLNCLDSDMHSADVDDGNTKIRENLRRLLIDININRVDSRHFDLMKASIGTFANKLGGSVATGLLNAAFEKAEGLSTITKRSSKLETIKERFLSYKRSADGGKNALLPILNYFDSTPLVHSNYNICYDDKSDKSAINIIDWTSPVNCDLIHLIKMDTNFGSSRLMELCYFTFNSIFIKYMNIIFNKLNTSEALKFLEGLLLHINHLRWPNNIISVINSIYNFLKLFSTFPAVSNIVIGQFTSDSEYRRATFKGIPYFVVSNIELIKKVYVYLDSLYTNFSLDVDYVESSDPGDVAESLFHGKNKIGTRIKSSIFMDEYVVVLLDAYETLLCLDVRKKDGYILDLSAHQELDLENKTQHMLPIFLHHTALFLECLIRIKETRALYGKNDTWLLWRRHVYMLLLIHPQQISEFDALYRPDSLEVLELLYTVNEYISDFDISTIDDFDTFKHLLLSRINIDNYYFIANAMLHVDESFASTIHRTVHSQLPNYSLELFDAARHLLEHDKNV